MENQLSEILDNLLGMLLLEGSYEIEEKDENFTVSIETKDAGRLIGARGESLDGLQLLVNQMVSRKVGEEGYKRVMVDVEGWRKQKEEELKSSAEAWGKQVLESGEEMALEPMAPWQRRIVHLAVEEIKGVVTESAGEGRDRHIVIKPETRNSKSETKETDAETKES